MEPVRLDAKPPITLVEADTAITEIRRDFFDVRALLFWRFDEKKGVQDRCMRMLNYVLPKNSILSHGDIQEIDNKRELALVMDKLMTCEKDLLTVTKSAGLLETVRVANFVSTYDMLKRRLNLHKRMLDDRTHVVGKVGIIQGSLSPIAKDVADNDFIKMQLLDPALELYKMFEMSLNQVKAEVDAMPDELLDVQENRNSKSNLLQDLEVIATELKEAYSRLHERIPNPKFVKTRQPANISDAEIARIDILLTGFSCKEKEYSFWKYFSTLSPTYLAHLVGSYSPSALLGVTIEKDVAQVVPGIERALQDLFTGIFQGTTEEERATKSINDISLCIARLQTKLEQHRESLYKLSVDDLTQTLLSFVNGCDMSLVELRLLHEIAESLNTPHILAVCKAERTLMNYLAPLGRSAVATLEEFEDNAALFALGKDISHFKGDNEAGIDEQLEACINRIAKTVNDIFENQMESTKSTENERAVWTCIFNRSLFAPISFDALYDKKENRDVLPARLQSVLVNRITTLLYLSKPAKIDSELEILLAIAKNDEKYGATLQANISFAEIIHAYDDEYIFGRKDELIMNAFDILFKINAALQDSKNALAFAQIFQFALEFARKKINCANVDEARKIKKRQKSLSQLLFSKLDALADDNGYPRLFQKFYLNTMEYWVTNEAEDGYTLMTELQKEGLKEIVPMPRKKLLLESFLLRALTAALYETDMHEKEYARQHVQNILELPFYESLRENLSDSILDLLHENTAQNILRGKIRIPVNCKMGDKDFPNELTLFMEGTVAACMEHEEVSFGYNSTFLAMYILSLQDRGMIAKVFKDHKKEKELLEKWCDEHQSLLVSSSVHRVYFDALIPEQDFFAGEKLNNPYVHNALVARQGKEEAEKWSNAAIKNKLYTDRLVAASLQEHE